MVLQRDEFNWLLLDPQNEWLGWTILPYKITDNVPKIFSSHVNQTVLRVKTRLPIKEKMRWNLLRVGSCVNIVLYMTGIKASIWTPYQLFKRLMRLQKKQSMKNGVFHVEYIY